MNIYRVGGPTHTQWLKDVAAAHKIIDDHDALIFDPEGGWTGVDPTKLPADFAEHYSNLTQVGAWHGWIAA